MLRTLLGPLDGDAWPFAKESPEKANIAPERAGSRRAKSQNSHRSATAPRRPRQSRDAKFRRNQMDASINATLLLG